MLSVLLGENPPRIISREQLRQRAIWHNWLHVGAGVLLIPTSLCLWWLSFWAVRWTLVFILHSLGLESWTASFYIAWLAMLVLVVDGVRYSAPLLTMRTFMDSDFYPYFSRALPEDRATPLAAWLASQLLYCAPRSLVLALRSFRTLVATDDDVVARAAAIRRELAESGKWTPAAHFSAADEALLLLERLELIWVNRDSEIITVRIPSGGDVAQSNASID